MQFGLDLSYFLYEKQLQTHNYLYTIIFQRSQCLTVMGTKATEYIGNLMALHINVFLGTSYCFAASEICALLLQDQRYCPLNLICLPEGLLLHIRLLMQQRDEFLSSEDKVTTE